MTCGQVLVRGEFETVQNFAKRRHCNKTCAALAGNARRKRMKERLKNKHLEL